MDLFTPITIGPLNCKNRIVMAPMTRCRAAEGNVPTELMATYYTQRASAGLIISEASQISTLGIGYPSTPGIHTPEQVQGWKKVTQAVHDKGGHIFLQLWHVGRISHPSYHNGALPVAPSAIKPAGEAATYEGMKPFVTPRALETEEIGGIVSEYAAAARNAIEAGFDGVEIHSANGYLLDQFLRDGTNQRSDIYGGSIENRSRFLFEVIEAVSAAIGADRVGLRLSPSGTFNDMHDSNPTKHFAYVCHRLNEFNLAYVHIIDALEGDRRHGANVVELSVMRGAFKGVLVANGGYDQDRANLSIQTGQCNAVSFGALFLANPDLPERFKAGAKLNKADTQTFYTPGEKGYTDYPKMNDL